MGVARRLHLLEITLKDGYIFKDENGNVINATKIVLEKVNTLKIQSDNMETETHKGYYTTEPETNSTGKKVAWFTFEDNDFADKVELDLLYRQDEASYIPVLANEIKNETLEEDFFLRRLFIKEPDMLLNLLFFLPTLVKGFPLLGQGLQFLLYLVHLKRDAFTLDGLPFDLKLADAAV